MRSVLPSRSVFIEMDASHPVLREEEMLLHNPPLEIVFRSNRFISPPEIMETRLYPPPAFR